MEQPQTVAPFLPRVIAALKDASGKNQALAQILQNMEAEQHDTNIAPDELVLAEGLSKIIFAQMLPVIMRGLAARFQALNESSPASKLLAAAHDCERGEVEHAANKVEYEYYGEDGEEDRKSVSLRATVEVMRLVEAATEAAVKASRLLTTAAKAASKARWASKSKASLGEKGSAAAVARLAKVAEEAFLPAADAMVALLVATTAAAKALEVADNESLTASAEGSTQLFKNPGRDRYRLLT
jgi:hypothetical protein